MIHSSQRTLVKDIAHWAIVQDHHFTQIRFHRAKIFDVGAIPECAVLSIVTRLEVFPFRLEPVDNGVGILLDTGCEDHELVPLGNLAQEIITVGPLMHIV